MTPNSFSDDAATLEQRPPIAPLRRRNLKDDVASHIREMVFAASLRPGMRVDQDEIAATLGISKLPVREALIVLEAEGLIVTYPSRGAFVAALSPEDFHDSYHAVGSISAIAAARAATKISDVQLVELRRLYEALEHDGDIDHSPSSIHHEFHRLVHQVGGSRRLNRVLRSLTNAIPERLHFHSRGSTMEVLAEHRELLEALEARDADRAAAATLSHFVNGAQHAVDLLAARGFWNEQTPPEGAAR
jgi:DNA-binding GntR family transcriptional regulator